MKTKTLLVLSLVAAIATGIFVVSPHYSIYKLREAARFGDSAELQARIDFVALKANIREQINIETVDRLQFGLKDNPHPIVPEVTMKARKMAEEFTNSALKPEGVKSLLRRLTGEDAVSASSTKYPNYEGAFEGLSFYSIKVGSEKESYSYRFTRDGLTWRLIGARIFDDSIRRSIEIPTSLYTISTTGWQRIEKTIEREVLRCLSCDGFTTVVVGISQPPPQIRTNEQFISSLRNDKKGQEEFAKAVILSQAVPPLGLAFKIESTRITKLDGRDAFEFVTTTQVLTKPIRNTITFAVHREQLISVTLNYYEGTFDERARREAQALLSSIKFQ